MTETTTAAQRVMVSQTIADQIWMVRQDGSCNLLDRPCVRAVAEGYGLGELVAWLDANPRDHARLVLGGYDVEEGG